MSGGFFRGTSADQDTRFSNKQAKLLKSQKFAPELEHLVDMTKVKMDVVRPWIANRVTELIGFEDEVLINFIYSLLDGKEVNGKEVQISLTGFMERNTGKFMKELWTLLLSAQKNASGVPQRFLDAKEEETKKKMAESDRIANEIQRKKEKESRELEQEGNKKIDAGNDISKGIDTGREPDSKHLPRASRERSAEEKEPKERNGSRGRSKVTKSPYSADHSSSPRRTSSRSVSKSFSNSRSYSNDRNRSRSLSASPKQRRHSSSSEMVHRSSPRRSPTPPRRHFPRRSVTPPRRRSSYSRRHMSPSPTRYRMRSPRRRRSRSPLGRRSRSPIRRWSRSPIWRSLPSNRSRSPIWPSSSSVRRKSPSLDRRRSPSPMRNRSPSPVRRRYRGSPLSPQLRSPSPVRHRSPMPSRRRSLCPTNRRSLSPKDWSSSSPVHRRSPLPIKRRSPKRQRSPVESPRRRKRFLDKDSPLRHASPRTGVRRRSKSLERRSQSDSWDRDDTRRKVKASSPSPRRSPPVSEDGRKMSTNADRRSSGPPHSPTSKSNVKITISYSPSPSWKSREYKPRHDSFERSADDKDTDYLKEDDKTNYKFSSDVSKTSNQHKVSHGKDDADELSPQRLGGHHPVQTQSRTGRMDSNKKAEVFQGGNRSGKMDRPKKSGHDESQISGERLLSQREWESSVGEEYVAVEKNQSRTNDIKIDRRLDALPKSSKKVEQEDRSSSEGSGSEKSDKNRSKVREKRKKKRSDSQGSELEDESSYDSYEEERKEAKRRRKEEKKSRKEEKRRRREERRRKKEGRRAEKLKLKSMDAVSSPSDAERYHDGHSYDNQRVRRQQSRRRNVEETEPEQKKLEIELREKALENLRAKKGIGH